MYEIYKLTAPSGRAYIGLTKQGVRARWNNHVRKAFTQLDYNHGLYNAIRKYGRDSFVVTVIDTTASKTEAQQLERKYIAASDKSMLYNVSPGGEADGEAGSKRFWDTMQADPKAKAEYLAKLSAIKKSDDWTDYKALAAKNAQWRKDNPKKAYRLARRGVRVASRNVPPKPEDNRTLKERLMWKHKRGEIVRKNTTAYWASLPSTKRKAVGSKISKAAKAHWAAVTDPEERSKLTAKARESIDRSKQGPAASAGIKRFWQELKADPERYTEYMARRTAALMQTIEAKLKENT